MSKETLSKLLQEAKELNTTRRNCTKTKEELGRSTVETQGRYKHVLFGNNSRICGGCLKELQEQIDDCIYQEGLTEQQVQPICSKSVNTVEDDAVLIDVRTTEAIGSFACNSHWKERL